MPRYSRTKPSQYSFSDYKKLANKGYTFRQLADALDCNMFTMQEYIYANWLGLYRQIKQNIERARVRKLHEKNLQKFYGEKTITGTLNLEGGAGT